MPTPPSPLADLGKEIVVLLCASCGTRLGTVTEAPDGPMLTLWKPTMSQRQQTASGGKLFAVESGDLPEEDEAVTVHCFDHGHVTATGGELGARVAKYRRSGRKQRLALRPS